jgi:FkbH-like protein
MQADDPTLVLVTSFNAANLAAILSKDPSDPVTHAVPAPFGQPMQALLRGDPELWTKEVVSALVWTAPEAISTGYKRLLDGEDVSSAGILSEVDEFCEAIKAVRGHVKHIIVPTWSAWHCDGARGLLDLHPSLGLSLALMRMNLRLAENLRTEPRVCLLDAARWIAFHGEKSFSPRLWYMSKSPYSVDFFKTAAVDIKAALQALRGQARKLLLLDLDDTLWGGVVGDVGWQNLRLGGHDPVGEAFRDFQLALKSLKRRGVLLGIVSKNEESTALEAIRSHPEMVLQQDYFAGCRINWEDKAQNIAGLAAELNLGLQSVVFIDNSPVERARVREALPEVFVPEWPEDPMLYKVALERLRCFDTPFISSEDRKRTEMYVSERKRQKVRSTATSLDAWLQSLDIQVTATPLTEAILERATQLLNKTNQMNLSTRRMIKEELQNWNQQPDNTVLIFRVSDKFGDYGLVGMASFVLRDGNANLVDFVLSCRAMGRKVEETMLHVLSACARSAGAAALHISYIPTLKNQPCLRFFENAGLLSNGDDKVFTLHLREAYPKPATTHLVFFDSFQEGARKIKL